MVGCAYGSGTSRGGSCWESCIVVDVWLMMWGGGRGAEK